MKESFVCRLCEEKRTICIAANFANSRVMLIGINKGIPAKSIVVKPIDECSIRRFILAEPSA